MDCFSIYVFILRQFVSKINSEEANILLFRSFKRTWPQLRRLMTGDHFAWPLNGQMLQAISSVCFELNKSIQRFVLDSFVRLFVGIVQVRTYLPSFLPTYLPRFTEVVNRIIGKRGRLFISDYLERKINGDLPLF